MTDTLLREFVVGGWKELVGFAATLYARSVEDAIALLQVSRERLKSEVSLVKACACTTIPGWMELKFNLNLT